MASSGSTPTPGSDSEASPFVIERYKYILQQIHTVNENLYRFLAIYQAILTTLVAAAIALFVNYRGWSIGPEIAREGIRALLVLTTTISAFTIAMIISGLASWLDYRHEECELTDRYFEVGFRSPPRVRNWYRWYETYVALFVLAMSIALWVLAETYMIPRIV